MARRSWRNFDYLLLVALLLLSAYGVTMIYSATINTLGLDHPVQRQIIFIAAGSALLLVTASVDYRLLDIFQHAIAPLTPLVLGLVNVALIITWRMEQTEVLAPSLNFFLSDVPAMAAGIVLVWLVFAIDRAWIEKSDLPTSRWFLAVLVAAGTAGAYLAANLLAAGGLSGLAPYLLVGALAVLYLLDCLILRFADTLRNPVYVLILGLLGIIFVIGQVSGGSQRWLGAGTVQPSELTKILIIVVLAKFLADREEEAGRLSTIVTSLGIVGIPMLLIYLQPDLGTALSLGAIWVAMIWMARIRLRYLLALAAAGLAALPVLWLSMEDYMRQRILLFINPGNDPDSYFNVHQALVSIGSGGWTGKGLTKGTQSQLHFLRVRHTDFIFAVTAEELGFLGALLLMVLLVFLLWRMLRIAEQARDTFGRLIAAGVVGLIFFQSVVNIGMNLGLMPVTGIPLPFVSYGGSSFMTLMLGVGLVESVAMRHKKLEFD
ncbi:MAG: FtsW/RodA/SpoVE family cell cycle protein [Anaerolineae bacterium]|jgi:rod shape determining protein RodA